MGKTRFLRMLVHAAVREWSSSAESALRGALFLLVSARDFVGAEEEIKARLDHLYAYLQRRPHVIPVFDGFEHLLNRTLPVYNLFAARFGGVLSGGGRAFALVCQTGPAGAADLLKNVKPQPLPALRREEAMPIVKARIQELLPAKWSCAPDEETFCNTLLNLARDRYPGQFLPGIAAHLVESAVLRAENRVYHLKEAPRNRVTVEDLWQHVAEEQGINPETFGKNPEQFYARLRQELKRDVLCQDHAVELVCSTTARVP